MSASLCQPSLVTRTQVVIDRARLRASLYSRCRKSQEVLMVPSLRTWTASLSRNIAPFRTRLRKAPGSALKSTMHVALSFPARSQLSRMRPMQLI